MLPDDTRALLEAPSAAVLAVYRANGTVAMSPVWFRAVGDFLEMVIAEGDPKLQRLRADRRCVFMAFEAEAPFRGLRVEVEAELSSDDVRDARLAIAQRYLGEAMGQRYAEQRTRPGTLVRLELSSAHTWDLRSALPS